MKKVNKELKKKDNNRIKLIFFQPGMRILSVDGHSLQFASHTQAVAVIRNAYLNKSRPHMEIEVSHWWMWQWYYELFMLWISMLDITYWMFEWTGINTLRPGYENYAPLNWVTVSLGHCLLPIS